MCEAIIVECSTRFLSIRYQFAAIISGEWGWRSIQCGALHQVAETGLCGKALGTWMFWLSTKKKTRRMSLGGILVLFLSMHRYIIHNTLILQAFIGNTRNGNCTHVLSVEWQIIHSWITLYDYDYELWRTCIDQYAIKVRASEKALLHRTGESSEATTKTLFM